MTEPHTPDSRRPRVAAFAAAALSAALLFGGPADVARAQAAPDQVEFLERLPEALSRAEREGRPVFVHFTAPWCAACREMKRRVYPLPSVRERLARFVTVSVDVEAEGGDELWMEYRVSGLPTLVFLRPDGREAPDLRRAGLQEEEAMVAALDRAIDALEPPPPPAPGEPRPSRRKRGGWWWVPGAGVVLLLVGAGAWAALRRRSRAA